MRNKNFFDAGHAAQYLTGSIIRVADHPVTVVGFDERSVEMIYLKLGEGENKSIRLDSPKVDLNPVPLGFANFVETNVNPVYYATYVMRLPERNWNIGLTHGNVQFIDIVEPNVINGTRHFMRQFLGSDALIDVITDKYPRLQDIAKAMSKDQQVRSRAFSRRFAINNRRELFFKWKTDPVGVLRRDLRFDLLPPNECLSQILTEDINNASD
jgi:hypothetical protein